MKKIFFILYALAVWLGGAVVGNCQNTGVTERHIFQVADKLTAGRIAGKGGRLIADYGGYKLYEGALSAFDLPGEKAEIRDQYNYILLNAARIDTSKPEAQAMRKKIGPFVGKRMHIVQFAGPIQTGWRKELLDTGVEIVGYIPQNGYLVYGDSSQIARVQALAAPSPHIRWDGAYLDEYKIQPVARIANAADHFAIQLVRDAKANAETLKLIDTIRSGPVERLHPVLNYVDIVTHFPAASLAQIAARPDVISIQRYGTPKKVCERQDQIVAGNLSGNVPSGPGYLAWLQSKGFTQAQFDISGFVIDITDSGIDNGTTSPDHFGLYAGGEFSGESRVAYIRLEGTASPGSSLKGCDGHGTLNAH
ncbi:MAG TPA: hypothetical protein VHZ30_06680, partial [Verrucomicrobiae bacterium]|nr:hypothetical protein [Verrucomicrobiae bacterium]